MSTTNDPMSDATDSSGRGGRTVGSVLLGIAGVIGILIALAGLALIAVHLFARDGDGYYTTDTERLVSARYAVASDAIDLGPREAGLDAGDFDASLKITAEPVNGKPVFVGIAPRADVDRYLRGVGLSRVDDFGDGATQYTQVRGAAPRTDPSAQRFWVAQAEGNGQQTVKWDVKSGTYTAVVMNADASPGIAVDGEAGVKIGWLIWVGIGLAVVGLVIAGGCGYGMSRLLRDRR